MSEGYILLPRADIGGEVFADPIMFKAWAWCIAKANYKAKTVFLHHKIGRGKTTVGVKRGQFIFGRKSAAEELGIHQSMVYRIMQKLEKMGLISIAENNQFSLVTICGYDTWQDPKSYKRTTNEQPTNNQRTANEQPSNTTNTDNTANNDNTNNTVLVLEAQFETFRIAYPGKRRGKATELNDLKKHKDWKDVIPLLSPALENLKKLNEDSVRKGEFVANWPMLQTFINQRRWETAITNEDLDRKIIGYVPTYDQSAYRDGEKKIIDKRPIYQGDAIPTNFIPLDNGN